MIREERGTEILHLIDVDGMTSEDERKFRELEIKARNYKEQCV